MLKLADEHGVYVANGGMISGEQFPMTDTRFVIECYLPIPAIRRHRR